MRIDARKLGAGAVAAVAAALVASNLAYATRAIQGSVGQVTQADGANLGQVGFRIFSALSGGETNVNDNISSCRNVRCIRNYVTNSNLNPGGYVSNGENTAAYNGDLDDQHFYELVDASMNDNAGNHIGYYGVSGVTTNHDGVGSFLLPGCPPPTATNCFERLDNRHQAPPLMDTNPAYGGGPHTIRAIGGLNPIPNVRLGSGFGTTVNLSWNDPPTYAGAMRPSSTAPAPPSPVLGVRLWKHESAGGLQCTDPTGNDPGWTSIGTFDLGETSTQATVVPENCTYFALTVRFIGPGGLPNEIETFRVGPNSYPVHSGIECFEGLDCGSDGNPCTLDVCHFGECMHDPMTGAPCDDGNGCTTNDVCTNTTCAGTPLFAPPEVMHDRFSSRTTLLWDPVPNAGPGTVYDVTKGRASELPPGSGVHEGCRAAGLTSPTLEAPESPPAAEALWYLVRARNTCAGGTWGSASNGAPRTPPACP